MHETAQSKEDLRRHVRAALAALTPDQKATASAKACALLQQQAEWPEAKSLLLYAPMPGELDIWPIANLALTMGKSVALPRFESETQRYVVCQVTKTDDLVLGRYNIREPNPPYTLLSPNHRLTSGPNLTPPPPISQTSGGLILLDLILVPGVAFDCCGRRLGRGKGHYDQLLAGLRGRKCGVGFDEQLLGNVPVEPHDVHLNCILTPTRWIDCSRAVLE